MLSQRSYGSLLTLKCFKQNFIYFRKDLSVQLHFPILALNIIPSRGLKVHAKHP
jgi:hypothetical protein